MGRCKSTNLCDYCAKLAAVENAEVLAQNAMTRGAPQVWSVLTTRSTTASMAAYDVARKGVTRTVRERWPEAERATLIEFQSGTGTNSGGERRPHWNDMWKGIHPSEADELHERLCWAWCKRVDALPRGQFVGSVEEVGGLMRYLALHFQKESQQPPKGWRSHRFTVSRGYLGEPMAAARERAREALKFRREVWKIESDFERLGLQYDAEWIDQLAVKRFGELHELSWELVRLQKLPTSFGEDGLPDGWRVVEVEVSR